MPLFKYKGFDTVTGKKVKGYYECDTEEELIYHFKVDDIEIDPEDIYVADTDSFEYKIDQLLSKNIGGNKVSKKQILQFTEQLSMQLSAKLTVSDAIGTMARDTPNKQLKEIYTKIHEDTVRGVDLSTALEKLGGFDDFFITIVRAGEQSGQLDVALQSLNEFIKKNEELKNRLIFASIYPAFLILAIIGGMVGMSVFIIPQFQVMFADTPEALNPLTIFYFNLSDFLRNHPLLSIGAFALVVGLIVFYFKTKNPIIRKFKDKLELRNPLYNLFLKDRQISQFAFTLSILLKNGIILTDALEMTKKMFSNQYVLAGLDHMLKNLLQGSPLNKELKEFRINKKQFLPTLFVQLATVGDATGNLEEPFRNVGDYYYTLFNNKATTIEKMMEPLMLVALLPVVFSFVLAVFLPLMNMGNAL